MRYLKLTLSLIVLLGVSLTTHSQATTFDGSSAETFILNEADLGGKTTLLFGTLANKYLQWDTSNLRFNLNDTLRVSGNLEQEGLVLTFDAENITSPGADIDIVANQGTDNPGVLRYSASNNQWEISNDGGAFVPIASGEGNGSVVGFEATIANQSSTTVTHASDPNNQRVVQVKELVSNTSATDTSLSFAVADENAYQQEDATNGTDFLGSRVRLHATFTGTGSTNLALNTNATASSSTNPPSNAVDGNDSNFWYTAANNANGGWIELDLGNSAPPFNRAEIRWYNATGTYNCSTFEIQGTNTSGSNYATVFTGNTVSDPQDSTYNFSPNAYQYWRFLCTVANNTTYYVVNEIRLFEALALYPTTPYYVTTGVNRLSTSSWTSLPDLSISQLEPANTSIRYLVSFDERSTWKFWNGSAWTASSLANLQTQGMTQAQLEALSTAQWFSAGGINSNVSQTLDFAFDLRTTNNSQTPSVDQIEITYTTPTYWRINTAQYDVKEFNDTQTQITNQTGETQSVKISVIVP